MLDRVPETLRQLGRLATWRRAVVVAGRAACNVHGRNVVLLLLVAYLKQTAGRRTGQGLRCGTFGTR